MGVNVVTTIIKSSVIIVVPDITASIQNSAIFKTK